MLFRKHTFEHFKTYLMSLGVQMGSLFLVMGWTSYMSSRPLVEEQELFFAFFLVGSGTIFTSTVFANLQGKNRAIATLMLPASQLEKYLVGWIYSFFLFLLVSTGSFYLVASLVLSLDTEKADVLNIFTKDNFALSMLVIYAMLHGIAIWGAVAFEKMPFIKTALGFFLLALLLIVLNNNLLEWMFDRELNNAVPFGNVSFQEQKEYFSVKLPEGQENLIGLFPAFMAALLWLAALVRLKEKQI